MKCSKCGQEITMIPYGYGWLGLCSHCHHLESQDRTTYLQNIGKVV